MLDRRLTAILVLAGALGSASAQEPSAILGEPNRPAPRLPFLDPDYDPLGPPTEPFRPFAPLGPPPDPGLEGIGTRYGLGLLAGRYGLPGYGGMWVPGQAVHGQGTNLSLLRQDVSLFAPIYREDADTAAVGLGVRNSLFFTDAVLPDSGRDFPNQLWTIEAGVAYAHQWENGWTSGAVVSAGSASDKPFSKSNTLVASLALYTAFPAVDQDAWILGASYSPTSDFPYPLPLASYYWRPSDDLEVNIGVPFFLKWRFADSLTLEALYVPIRTVSLRVTCHPEETPDIRYYAAFNWANESHFLADRTDDTDRFYAFERRLSAGVTFDLIYRLRLDVSAGYMFDRFYFQGKQYSDRNRDRVDVGSGLFGALQLRLQF